MRFDFFTLGGSHFWEDVFFYQKWRIQRNYNSKVYRLLDNWDIKRCSGTFEDCRKAFLKNVEVYEISRQRGHMIIMLHGMFESKNTFKPLWREALKEGYLAAAINYPSSLKDLNSHVRQLEFLMNNLEDVQEVSFVTKGAGSLILRKLLHKKAPWQNKLKINRIVQICPPESNPKFFDKLARYKLFRWMLGPFLEDATSEKLKVIPKIAKSIETGTIVCSLPCESLFNILPARTKSGNLEEIKIEFEKNDNTIELKNLYFNVFNNKEVVSKTINFIKSGDFDKRIKKL